MNTSQLLHNESIKAEIENRQNPTKQYDYTVADKMIGDLNKLGYNFSYVADLQYCITTDKRTIPIFQKYIPLFQDPGFAISMLPHISQKGYYDCTEFLIQLYSKYEHEGNPLPVISDAFDNALVRIKDKRYIQEYCTLISPPQHLDRFYLLMELLSKWQIKEALPIITERLRNDKMKATAIKSLGNYCNPEYIFLLNPYLNDKNSYIRKVTKQSIAKMTKHNT